MEKLRPPSLRDSAPAPKLKDGLQVERELTPGPGPIPRPAHSVRKRFAFTVVANLFRSLLSFVTGMLLARWLGPSDYGNMAFLLGTFVGLRLLLDMGTSTAFFTFLSQQPRSRRFVVIYYAWLAVQFVVPLLVLGLLLPTQWIETIWRGQQRGLVLLAFAATFMQNSVWAVVQQAGESQRKTLLVQAIGVAVVALHLLVVGLLWATGTLGLYAVFAVLAVEYLAASLIAQKWLPFDNTRHDSEDELKPLLRKYLVYCLPMIPYAAMGFAQEFADRWLLQTFGGGIQQAFYAVGAQFAAIALLATTSILRIFWKEVAEAHHQKDHARAHRLYQRVSRLLFLIGAIVAGFLIPWSQDLLDRLLGAAYVGGATTLAIMFLYPIHQSMGQIGNTVLFATERVKIQVITGILTMLVGLVVSYFMIAPPTARIPGLGLQSQGLALKMVGVQLLSVNVVAYLVARLWARPFDWIYQPVSLIGCVTLGWVAHAASVLALGASPNLVLLMAGAALIYIPLIGSFVYAVPWTAGLTRAELVSDLRAVTLGRLTSKQPAS
jgi:O-antigen/teichoic acid export membrane protein